MPMCARVRRGISATHTRRRGVYTHTGTCSRTGREKEQGGVRTGDPGTLLTQGRPRRRDSRHHTAVQGPRFLREKPAVVHGTRRVCTVSIVKNRPLLAAETRKQLAFPPNVPSRALHPRLLLSNGREADRSLTSSLRRQSVCRCTARQSRRRLSTAPRWRPSRLLAPPPMPVAHSRREAAVRPLQRLSPIVQQRRTAFCASARAAATTRNLAPHPLL